MRGIVIDDDIAKITIHIPNLSKEERNERIRALKRAAEGLLKSSMKGHNNNDKDIKGVES